MHRLQNLKHAKLVAFNLIILLLLLYNFPFLYYPLGNPDYNLKNQTPIRLEGTSLFLADIHFKGRPLDIGTYLDIHAIDNLIIIGDLFDSPDAYYEYGLQETLRRLNLDAYPGPIYFTWGPPHDPLVNIRTDKFHTLGEYGYFETAHYQIVAQHGIHRSRYGSVLFAVNYFISYPILEHLWRIRVGIPEDVWTFFGHSHIAKLYPELKIANCGGFPETPIVHPPRGIGIQVDEQIRLITIPF
ncbi:MAG: hypothetical protein ACFFGZ_15285 [Candidatus Thorarchaeota archaeon]